VIHGLEGLEDVEVTHAGTSRRGGEIVTAGGRVLNVTGMGASIEDARDRAYAAVERIEFDGSQYRSDIAARVAERVAS
jgi:phosphoribosylamine--glycine ligase